MKEKQAPYNEYALVREMFETGDIIRRFDYTCVEPILDHLLSTNRLLLTGEGSSRIFPAGNMIYNSLKYHADLSVNTDGARQAAEYDLRSHIVIGASNSGKTKELVALFDTLAASERRYLFGLTASADNILEERTNRTFLLSCGKEEAVAATKSVVEQGLFYHALLAGALKRTGLFEEQSSLADAFIQALETKIDADLVARAASSSIIYFAGRNNGVAEELTLKTNEITRKKSAYLEGTYAVHGVEEVMEPTETVVLIDPYPAEEEKFQDTLGDGVGMNLIAISDRQTCFPTIRVPAVNGFNEFIQLAAGWNLLTEIGLSTRIDLDHPVRARKIGNEFSG